MTNSSREQMLLNVLEKLPPLPVRHVASPAQAELWTPERPEPTQRIATVTRIIGSLGLNANGQPFGSWRVYREAAFELLARLNRQRRPDATLALGYLPYLAAAPGAIDEGWGEADVAEFARFEDGVRTGAKELAAFNAASHTNVRISTIYVNAERLCADRNDRGVTLTGQRAELWNQLLVKRHALLVQSAKRVIPGVEVIQYQRGGLDVVGGDDGLGSLATWPSNYFPAGSPGDAYTFSLYSLYDLRHAAATWRVNRLAAAAARERFAPFVALGCGFDFRHSPPFNVERDPTWNYPLEHDWLIGALLNRAVQPDRVVLYPSPFAELAPGDGGLKWLAHFTAYALGAAGRTLAPLTSFIMNASDPASAAYWRVPPLAASTAAGDPADVTGARTGV